MTLPADEQILITREFDAPRDLVYRAWTTPELVKRWWAGKRGEVTSAEIDLRVGGRWRYVMSPTAGSRSPSTASTARSSRTSGSSRPRSTRARPVPDPDASATLNRATFAESDGRTLLEVLVECPSREVRDAIIDSGMEGGMQEGMDLLEQVAQSLR